MKIAPVCGVLREAGGSPKAHALVARCSGGAGLPRTRDRSHDHFRRAVAHRLTYLLFCISTRHNSREDPVKDAYCELTTLLASGGSTKDTPTQPSDVEFLMPATLHCPIVYAHLKCCLPIKDTSVARETATEKS